MIGALPKKLNINGIDRAIRCDYRVALLIFEAFNDPELSDEEKALTMLECLYEDYDSIPPEDIQEAAEKAIWYLDGGGIPDDNSKHQQAKKIMDWEQDEKLIFSAVNKVAGFETRAVEYMHWWTFLGYFNEIGEGLFTTVINIRQKRNNRKKLEKYEEKFYRENRSLIDLKKRYTAEEQAELERLNSILPK